jgi:GNAT superfamily N-acetyltransferase
VLRRGFDADPLIGWFLRADGRREEALGDFVSDSITEYAADGHRIDVAELDGNVAGAALWTAPPGAQPSPWRARAGVWGLRRWTGLRRLPRLGWLVVASERRYPRTPHWYLYLVAVDPEQQGRGVGSALLAAGLARADAEAMPAYLEATSERNSALYARVGFERAGVLRYPLGGPPLYPMLRPPVRR